MTVTQGAGRATARDHDAGAFEYLGDRIGSSPGRITIVYVVFGFSALVVSDFLLPEVLSGDALVRIQAVKGGLEVVLTAGLIYFLTSAGHASLRRASAEVERSRMELQVLHRVFRHNLRNNLTLVLGNAQRLVEDLEDPSRRARCAEVIAAAEEIRNWTEQAGEIRRVTADSGTVTVDLADAIPSAIASVEEHSGEVAVETTMPDSARVTAAPQFELAIEELLSNAVEHAEADRPGVEVSVTQRGSETTIEVTDEGPGFPEHVRRAINDRGEDSLVHLDGLGLWLAYLVVANSDGDLTLENHSRGATARITVPSA